MKNFVEKKVKYALGVFQLIVALGLIEVYTSMPVLADVESTVRGVEEGFGDQLRKFANPALGIAVLIYGGATLLGNGCSTVGKEMGLWSLYWCRNNR
uniref:Pd96 protein n=1 Tax=Enterococcus faecalis TaxID=1351 RepID=Q47806_ENTFL|nr:pd96 [Enterococcus faecalis] [Enterococcus faecalis OG1X]